MLESLRKKEMESLIWILPIIALSSAMPSDADTFGCVGQCPADDATNDVYLLPHLNCSQFCSCIDGIPQVMECPKGFYYSGENQGCTLESEAQCKSSRRKDEETPFAVAPRHFEDGRHIEQTGKSSCCGTSSTTQFPIVTVTASPTTITVTPTSTTTCIATTVTVTPTSTTTICLPSTTTVTSTVTTTSPPSTATTTTTETSTTTTTTTTTITIIPTPTVTVTPTSTVTTIPTITVTCTDTVTAHSGVKVIPTLIATPSLPGPTSHSDFKGCIGTCPPEDPMHAVHLSHQQCNKFCKCSYGSPHVFTCDPGLHFNRELQVCDLPSMAKCDRMSG